MPLEIAADLVGDLVDLPLGLLQSGLGLRGPRGSLALSPGRFIACSPCPSRSLEPAHDPVAPSASRCGDMPATRPRPVHAQTHEGRARSRAPSRYSCRLAITSQLTPAAPARK